MLYFFKISLVSISYLNAWLHDGGWSWVRGGCTCGNSIACLCCPSYCTVSGLKGCQQYELAAFVSQIYWLHFWRVGGHGDELYILCQWHLQMQWSVLQSIRIQCCNYCSCSHAYSFQHILSQHKLSHGT